MKLEQLVALFRSEVDDTAAPYLWTDPEVIDYAADAEMEACRRALLLIDSSTVATCQYTVAPGASVVTLDPRVLAQGFGGNNTRRTCAQNEMVGHRPSRALVAAVGRPSLSQPRAS